MSAALTVDTAAVRSRAGIVYTLPRPNRHDSVLRWLFANKVDLLDHEQGFVLSDGSFADRKASFEVALASGQVRGQLLGSVLTSEDLW